METIIEAGHYYSALGPTNVSLLGWDIGKQLAADIPDAKLALFIDDYHSSNNFMAEGEVVLDEATTQQAVETILQDADHVFSEAQIALGAGTAATTWAEAGLAKVKKGGILSASGIRLGSYQGEDFVPTCAMLDLLLVQEKLKLGSNQIVVLPESFSNQQQQVATLIQKVIFAGMPEAEAAVQTAAIYQPVYYNLGGVL